MPAGTPGGMFDTGPVEDHTPGTELQAQSLLPTPVGEIGKIREPLMLILLHVVTLGLWSVVVTYQNHREMWRYRKSGLPGIAAALLYVFVPFPVMGFVSPMLVGSMYVDEGLEPPVSVWTGLWFLLPVFGTLILYVNTQNALNQFWASKMPLDQVPPNYLPADPVPAA